MFFFSGYMSFMDSEARSYWRMLALASFFLIATFIVRDYQRQEVRLDLAPLEEHYLTLLGQLFEGELAPEVQRYRAQVISQGRDFTIGECKALRAFNLQWSLGVMKKPIWQHSGRGCTGHSHSLMATDFVLYIPPVTETGSSFEPRFCFLLEPAWLLAVIHKTRLSDVRNIEHREA